MQRTILSSKIHQARLTHAELEYEGSCAIDEEILQEAGIAEFEQIQIYNIDNGERFTTYAIKAERGSKIFSLNGAAAHKGSIGDRVIICTYAVIQEQEFDNHRPCLIYLNSDNNITRTKNSIGTQAAK